jgi:hypothetical protein
MTYIIQPDWLHVDSAHSLSGALRLACLLAFAMILVCTMSLEGGWRMLAPLCIKQVSNAVCLGSAKGRCAATRYHSIPDVFWEQKARGDD